MTDHPLDRAVWSSLATRRAWLAVGDERARRLRPDVGLFIAGRDRSAESLAAMSSLVAPGETVGMIEAETWPQPPGTTLVNSAALVQMMAPSIGVGERPAPGIVALDDNDAAEMLALATLTRPGPFFADTHCLGGFLGIKHDGSLIAMAGTRLALPGYVEVSGVCTHPDHRGRGLAAALIGAVGQAILAAGDTPFLTSYAANKGAIALYERLGFRTRRVVTFTLLTGDAKGAMPEQAPPPT